MKKKSLRTWVWLALAALAFCEVQAFAEEIDYEYSRLGWLRRASYDNGNSYSSTAAYDYDDVGNRIYRETASGNGDEIALDFGAVGLWHYDAGTWALVMGVDAKCLARFGDDLVISADACGVSVYNGAISQISAIAGSKMASVGDVLYVDFGDSGLQQYDASGAWTVIHAGSIENLWTYDNKLVVDDGANGLWEYDGAWTKIHEGNAVDAVGIGTCLYVKFAASYPWSDNSKRPETAPDPRGDFGASGVWKYSAGAWTLVMDADATVLEAFGDHLAIGSDAYGIYIYNGTLVQISEANGLKMKSVGDALYVDFGDNGLWKYDAAGAWSVIFDGNLENLWGYSNKLVVDHGENGLWQYDGSWMQIRADNAEDAIAVNVNR